MNFNLSKIKQVHFIGIGGIAVSADAKFLIGIGKNVTGSDAHDSDIVREVEKKGAKVYVGHKARNLDKYADLVIYSPAVPFENVERAKARKSGIREMSHTEFLGYLSRQMKTVAVSGTNGKSTTTAMLGLILEKAGVDPTVIVGSKIPGFEKGNLRAGAEWCDRYRLAHGKIPPSALWQPTPFMKGGKGIRAQNDIFVVEGCEYKAGMLELNPEMIVLTNIEEDHLDYYKNLKDIKRVFRKYVKKVERGGAVIYNLDDRNSVEVMGKFAGKKVSYGIGVQDGKKKLEIGNWKLGKNEKDISPRAGCLKSVIPSVAKRSRVIPLARERFILAKEIPPLAPPSLGRDDKTVLDSPREGGQWGVKRVISDVTAEHIKIKNKRQILDVYRNGKKLGEIRLRVPGIFNVYNALAAIAASLELGVDFKVIKKTLEEFNGIWRRFEIVGNYKGAILISDYAHHPTAIQSTIKAAREFYSKRRIVVVFQPHSHNRTQKLFKEFAESFYGADLVILSEVYDVEGREKPKDRISSRDLAEAIKKRHNNCRDEVAPSLYGAGDVLYAENLKETGKILRKNIGKNDVILLMGAGDIYKLKV